MKKAATGSGRRKVRRYGLTVEGQVAEQRRDQVKHEAEADADIGNVLHPGLSGPEAHKSLNVTLYC